VYLWGSIKGASKDRVHTLTEVATAGGVGHGKGQGFSLIVVAADDDVWWSSIFEDDNKSGYMS